MESSGWSGVPVLGEITWGKVDGRDVAVVPAAERVPEDGWAMMVDGSHKAVAESVPVGVTV